ncbi:FZO-like [Hibiscus syriacus]|uniref:FZO-like n=1 Tax=Hibiscus syriacus TaxID=106335 RepID=A0A6A2YQG6_HIBSY|nr:FZO-like [Hibiscus syriacus]
MLCHLMRTRNYHSQSRRRRASKKKLTIFYKQIDEQLKTIEELNFKATKDSSPIGSPRGAVVRYRNLYFESQKIESLMNENHQLALKLERALGKLEAYENGASAISEGLKKMKETILVTNLTRSTETAVNFSTQAFPLMDAGAEPLKKKKARTGK